MKQLLVDISMAAMLMATNAYADTTLRLVEVITSSERTTVLQGIVSEYEAANEGVTVEIISLPWGQAFETIGFAGWSIFNTTEREDEAWELLATLSSPEANSTWAQRVGVIPIHEGADQDPHFQTDQFSGWFETMNSVRYVPTIMPSFLEE